MYLEEGFWGVGGVFLVVEQGSLLRVALKGSLRPTNIIRRLQAPQREQASESLQGR